MSKSNLYVSMHLEVNGKITNTICPCSTMPTTKLAPPSTQIKNVNYIIKHLIFNKIKMGRIFWGPRKNLMNGLRLDASMSAELKLSAKPERLAVIVINLLLQIIRDRP